MRHAACPRLFAPALIAILLPVSSASAGPPEEAGEMQGTPQNSAPHQDAPLQTPPPVTNYDGYPVTALRQRREGTSGYSFIIGDDGQMRNCKVTHSSGHADLDAATCPRLRRFPPPTIVRDEQGKAIKAHYQGFISWELH